MSNDADKLSRWWRRLKGGAKRLELVQVNAESQTLVHAWVDELAAEGFDGHRLGHMVLELAQELCDDEDRAVRFEVLARSSSTGGDVLSRSVLRLRPGNAEWTPREDASADGLVAQLIRHNEMLVQASLKERMELGKAYGSLADAYVQILDRLGKRNAKLEGVAEETRSTKSGAEETAAEVDAMVKMKMLELVQQYGPILAQKLLEPPTH